MRRFGVVLALLAAAAAGCSKERAGALPTASATPAPVTASPTTTAAPSTSAPATDEAAIEAAARAYYDTLEQAGRTGDVANLMAMMTADCDCRQQVTTIQNEHRAGRRFTTDYVVDAVDVHDVDERTGFATVTITYAESQVVDRSGRVVRTIPGKTKAGRDLRFEKEGTTWRLDRIVLLG